SRGSACTSSFGQKSRKASAVGAQRGNWISTGYGSWPSENEAVLLTRRMATLTGAEFKCIFTHGFRSNCRDHLWHSAQGHRRPPHFAGGPSREGPAAPGPIHTPFRHFITCRPERWLPVPFALEILYRQDPPLS